MRLHRYSEALGDYNDAVRTGPADPSCLIEGQIDYSRLQSMQEQASQALENEKFQLAQRQATAEAERQQRVEQEQERARLEQAQRQALEAARQKAAQEAERQRLAAEAAVRLEATLYKYTRIGNWLPHDLAEVFEALSEDYVHELIGQRSHLVIEDEQTISSQVKQIRNEEEARTIEAARLEAVRAAEAKIERARIESENRQWLAARIFGAEKWNRYFGNVGAEPPLPPNIREVLLAPCPIWPGKRVEETHKLVLVPESLNGASLYLMELGKLVRTPRQGHSTDYSVFMENTYGKYGDVPVKQSHWVLMTRDVVPETRNKIYTDQKALIARLGGNYQVPLALDAAICILMEHVETGVRLFPDEPSTFARCLDQIEGSMDVIIGNFAPGSLTVIIDRDHENNGNIGCAALRIF